MKGISAIIVIMILLIVLVVGGGLISFWVFGTPKPSPDFNDFCRQKGYEYFEGREDIKDNPKSFWTLSQLQAIECANYTLNNETFKWDKISKKFLFNLTEFEEGNWTCVEWRNFITAKYCYDTERGHLWECNKILSTCAREGLDCKDEPIGVMPVFVSNYELKDIAVSESGKIYYLYQSGTDYKVLEQPTEKICKQYRTVDD